MPAPPGAAEIETEGSGTCGGGGLVPTPRPARRTRRTQTQSQDGRREQRRSARRSQGGVGSMHKGSGGDAGERYLQGKGWAIKARVSKSAKGANSSGDGE